MRYVQMKESLDHLPEGKQEQVKQITEVIREISPAKVILFGSYATGKWQQDSYVKEGTLHEYVSDFDLLVVMKDENLNNVELQDKIENKCRSKAPINAIVHSVDFINKNLEKGVYFFVDIVREGVLLFDTREVEFVEPKILTPKEKKAKSEEHFNHWFDLANEFQDLATISFEKAIQADKKLNVALYILYQSIESLYSAVLLVFKDYKPKSHNLDKFRRYVRGISDELDKVFPFPTDDRREKELFEFFKRSYIGAKYKVDFEISRDDLKALMDRVHKFKVIAGQICQKKIASLDPDT